MVMSLMCIEILLTLVCVLYILKPSCLRRRCLLFGPDVAASGFFYGLLTSSG